MRNPQTRAQQRAQQIRELSHENFRLRSTLQALLDSLDEHKSTAEDAEKVLADCYARKPRP